jgi:hypothetical protein
MKDLQTLTGGLVSRKARGKHAHVHHQEHADHSH